MTPMKIYTSQKPCNLSYLAYRTKRIQKLYPITQECAKKSQTKFSRGGKTCGEIQSVYIIQKKSA